MVFLARDPIAGASISVFAVDPHTEFVGILSSNFGTNDRIVFYEAMLKNECSQIVSLINLSSEQFSASWSNSISLLWIDGDHRYEGFKRDFNYLKPHLTSDALVVFDDATDSNLDRKSVV